MRKKFSILILSDSGTNRSYTLSYLVAKILLGIVVCIVIGAVWVIFNYSTLIKRSITIQALRHENDDMRQKYNKLREFENEFNGFKKHLTKVADALDVHFSATVIHPEVIFNPKDSFPELASNPNTQDTSTSRKEGKGVPSIYPVKGWITQKFSSSHPALDLSAEYGASVVSTMDGEVEFAGSQDTLGKVVEITHPNGYQTIYGHLARINVVSGTKVKSGDLIGYVGSTGESSAPHIHYEVRLDGIPKDPERYLPK
ncbi:MAG: M23 family metallopeptidase [Candidatus Stahlbacteria bacterium]|nr:M23 family metallopeptidase [Candidatus Stahlbacteria bacterium]